MISFSRFAFSEFVYWSGLCGMLLGALFGCTSEAPEVESPEFHFEETLQIGSDDPEAPDHQLYSQVAAAAVGPDGTIYAVDARTGGVRVYDAVSVRHPRGAAAPTPVVGNKGIILNSL